MNSSNLTNGSPEAGTAAAEAPSKQTLLQHIMDSLEVMELLHICRGTLYNWRKKGLIAFSKVGGRVYFETTDVNRMLKERKHRKFSPAS